MARTTGPLLSMDASGSVGNALTFAKWKGRNYVRRYAVPSNPQSTGQESIRSGMALYTAVYKNQTANVTSAFQAKAESEKYSVINAFISSGLNAWKSSILILANGAERGTWTSSGSVSVTGSAQQRGITWSWTESLTGTQTGAILLVRKAADPGTTTQYAVHGTASGTSYLLTGLDAATSYQARIVVIMSDGTVAYSAANTTTTP